MYAKVVIKFQIFTSKGETEKNLIETNGWKLYKANHDKYDGPLTQSDAPKGVFFNSGLYNGNLPTITQYLRSTQTTNYSNKKYPRIAINISQFQLGCYSLFLVKNPTKTDNYDQVME